MPASQPARRTLGSSREGYRSSVLNIGEVLQQLTDDFPQISASKIRFLEEKGLISPQRTPAGYRKYTGQDVERLRFVLALQRDQYLPLKVIKDYLDAIDRGERPEALPGGVTLSPRMVSDPLAAELNGRGRALTRGELLQVSGASPELVDDLLAYGLIHEKAHVSTNTRSRWFAPACSWTATESSRGTCGRSGPRRTANSGWWSVLWRRWRPVATSPHVRAPRRPPGKSAISA